MEANRDDEYTATAASAVEQGGRRASCARHNSSRVPDGVSLLGGVGTATGATLIQTETTGLAFAGVNLCLHPIIQAIIIFLDVHLDLVLQHMRPFKRRRDVRPVRS